jgi:hypothetical protein
MEHPSKAKRGDRENRNQRKIDGSKWIAGVGPIEAEKLDARTVRVGADRRRTAGPRQHFCISAIAIVTAGEVLSIVFRRIIRTETRTGRRSLGESGSAF